MSPPALSGIVLVTAPHCFLLWCGFQPCLMSLPLLHGANTQSNRHFPDLLMLTRCPRAYGHTFVSGGCGWVQSPSQEAVV